MDIKHKKKNIIINILASIGLMTIGGLITSIIFFIILNSSTYGYFGVMKYIEELDRKVYSIHGLIQVVKNMEEFINTEFTEETDFEREINLKRVITKLISVSIESLNNVYKANVNIVWSKENYTETAASVIIEPIQGMENLQIHEIIDSIYNIITTAVRDIKIENIIITNINGIVLNN